MAKPIKIVLTGDMVHGEFRKFEEAIMENMGTVPPIFSENSVVVAAKGAAELWRRGEAPWRLALALNVGCWTNGLDSDSRRESRLKARAPIHDVVAPPTQRKPASCVRGPDSFKNLCSAWHLRVQTKTRTLGSRLVIKRRPAKSVRASIGRALVLGPPRLHRRASAALSPCTAAAAVRETNN
jgi:hypothetical protein